MDSAINISSINDFLFCPKSLYLHSIFSSFNASLYHESPQVAGKIVHENIENGKYATTKYILQGLPVYSSRLGIKGKIDIYDAKNKYLIERKNRIKYIYKGYKYQLYAQMYCLEEAGFKVKKLFFHSLSNNKHYEIPLPAKFEKKEFEETISQMRSFNTELLNNHSCSRCSQNIYSLLNW